jgi:hypothetical protein
MVVDRESGKSEARTAPACSLPVSR